MTIARWPLASGAKKSEPEHQHNSQNFFQPFPKQQILDSSKLKKFADDNSKFDKNGRKFSKSIQNTVEKGEIARYEQFLLSPQCFQRLVLQTRKNQDLFGKGLNELAMTLTFDPMTQIFDTINIVYK